MTGLPGRTLARLFALALAARLAVLPFTLPRYGWGRAYPDTAQYEAMAANLLDGQGLVVSDRQAAVRPPLYPVLLAGFRAALGSGRAFVLGVVLAQCGMMALASVLAADLGSRLFGPSCGRLAGLACALHPELLLYPSLLLSETLAVLLVVAAPWACAVSRTAWRPWRWAVAAGAFCGAAALTRASLLPLAPLAAVWLGRTLRPGDALACLGAAALMVLPWTLRNRARLGAWVPVTTKMGWDLYEQNCPEATGGPIYETIRWPREVEGMAEVEADLFLRRAARDWALGHPRRVLELTLSRVRRFWSPVPNDPAHRGLPFVLAGLASNLPLFALAGLGFVTIARAAPSAWALAAMPVLLLALVHAVFMGSVRYRAPAIPALAVLAASAAGRRRA